MSRDELYQIMFATAENWDELMAYIRSLEK